MRKQVARWLRKAATRLDPPKPMAVHIYGVPGTAANTIAHTIIWRKP